MIPKIHTIESFRKVPSVGPSGPNRLLVSLLLSMAVCLPVLGDGPSLFLTGGTIQVRLTTPLDSAKSQAGEVFLASVDRDVERDGKIVVPRGATVHGVVRSATPSGHISGRSAMTLELESVEVGGRTMKVESEPEIRLGPRHRGHNARYGGAGMTAGMIVGGIATGGAGFVLGALAGGAAGIGAGAVTGKHDIHIPAETVMIFRLKESANLKTLVVRPGSSSL
jgi:hypothetical protein